MKATTLLAAVLLAGSMAVAADVENAASQTVNTSKNPITGSVTKTKKTKKNMKNGKGDASVEVTEKTTTTKDGTVKTSTEVDATSEKKH